MENLNLDKSTWKKVKFGDVVIEPKETCKDIHLEGIEHVVALEHIDSGDIHLRKSATTEESTTFTKKFRKGDVLFGRRRAYLKKAAQAKFDGICSGDITVFRAQKNLLPELLPFIVNNDKFFDYAIKHSAGGLSPRVKFKDLANYEFLLPPKEEQAKIAELLWAMDEVIEREKEVLSLEVTNCNSFFNNTITKGINLKEKSIKYKSIFHPYSWKPIHLSDLLTKMSNGISESQNNFYKGIKVTRIETISDGTVNPEKTGYVDSDKDYSKYFLNKGDILFSHINSVSHIGKVAYYDDDFDLYHGVNLMRLQSNENVIRSKFLFYHLKNAHSKYFFERRAKQAVNQASLDQDDIGSLPLSVPDLTTQDLIISKMEIIEHIMKNSYEKIKSSQSLQKSLINQVF